jgi:RNA polymerase sigma-70 factor (ECF subfamily)
MYGVALRMVAQNAADAEDVVQEAWVRAIRGLASFRGESALRTWLVGITVRCALEAVRRRLPSNASTIEPVAAAARRLDLGVDLERVIAALADGYRHVLVLHDIYGYTHAEIAALLGVDEGTSKSQLSRARRSVRRALEATPMTEECQP